VISRQIYLINLKSAENPRELTSGTHGSARAPKFNSNGDKVAWLEQADDGNEAARTYVVVYDLAKDIRYVLGGTWDRSADSLAVRMMTSTLVAQLVLMHCAVCSWRPGPLRHSGRQRARKSLHPADAQ
jgi:hypothetical protein